jgi:pimeloyl-ACP methyl ester carboxylesterase
MMATVRRTRRIPAALLVGLALALIAPAGAAAQKAKPKPTVVLVHGAFADALGWNGVTKRLQRRGYTVLAPANPLRGVNADAAYLRSVLSTI